jgi:hypothetical protein
MFSIEAPMATARQLHAERRPGTSRRPPREYGGCSVNAEGNFALEAGIRGEVLRMHVNRLPDTYYDLQHYYDDIFAWECDRDEEARRALLPQLSGAFKKICSQCGEQGGKIYPQSCGRMLVMNLKVRCFTEWEERQRCERSRHLCANFLQIEFLVLKSRPL